MDRIRTVVIDDEPLALRVIQSHAQKIPFIELVYSTTKAIDALAYLQQNPADLILLDVQMPELNGLQFMKIISGRAKVILVTAYQQYAFDSYEHDVLDYLLKPVSFERLLKAAQKALGQIRAERYFLTRAMPPAGSAPEVPAQADCLFIKTEYRLQKVFFEDILYLEGGKDYVTIFTRTEKILSLAGLTKIQQNLPYPQFMRVHKSYVVALNKIDSIERQRIYIGKVIIPVSDTYKEEFARNINSI